MDRWPVQPYFRYGVYFFVFVSFQLFLRVEIFSYGFVFDVTMPKPPFKLFHVCRMLYPKSVFGLFYFPRLHSLLKLNQQNTDKQLLVCRQPQSSETSIKTWPYLKLICNLELQKYACIEIINLIKKWLASYFNDCMYNLHESYLTISLGNQPVHILAALIGERTAN